ncbi:RING/U-box superfamily protein [Actinidia rufa]|uniref:RING-type E3 ubiquitin transferase n=1 Tax=Actinidia rufa TaxID=165716 RepID=A0A7J0E5A2_9ERIC|nr:RING/U-box superfamily protein [Actinidia rufa]
MANLHRRLLGGDLVALPGNGGDNVKESNYIGGNNFDTNMVIILAALLCALICALGLNLIVRCAIRCRRRFATEGTEQEATGMKKRALRQIPVLVYGVGLEIPATDCPICLGEFVEGERVREAHALVAVPNFPKCQPKERVLVSDTLSLVLLKKKMQSERQPSSWQIHLRAKAKVKHFDLKLQADTSNLYRFRIHLNLKLCPSNLLRYKKSSDSHLPNTPGKRRSMKSKFLRILRNKFKNKFTASHQTSHPQAHFPVNQPTQDAYQVIPSSFSQWACRGDNFLGYWNF